MDVGVRGSRLRWRPLRRPCAGVLATVRKTGGEGWRLAEANVTLCQELALASLASLDGEDDVFSLVEVLRI